jgi:exodeoxyribonuclease X
MLIRVIDTETTGFPPNASVCQVGWTDVTVDSSLPASSVHETFEYLVKPEHPISLGAMAIHHLQERDVADAEPLGFYLPMLEAAEVLAFHNAAFDMTFFPSLKGKPVIDTLKCAYVLYPEAERHSNQYLRYYLELFDLPPERAMPPHGAGPDTFVTAHILVKMLEKVTAEELIKISQRPTLLPRVNFGKYRGKLWKEVPIDYLSWLAGQDLEEDVRYTVRLWINTKAGRTSI